MEYKINLIISFLRLFFWVNFVLLLIDIIANTGAEFQTTSRADLFDCLQKLEFFRILGTFMINGLRLSKVIGLSKLLLLFYVFL